jgi:methylmalonyl-CoA mutase
VSICTVDDMKRLYSGFKLLSPSTSVSMTINGPAPTILAFFLNTAIDQQVERHLRETGGWDAARKKLAAHFRARGAPAPVYRGELPPGHDGVGIGLLGASADQAVDAAAYGRIREATLREVRGTVQADILKEDQAQNTCIFSTEFALAVMGDIEQYFIDHDMANFYSVSVSGYHMAEAGANPITQVAFTLANGLTFVEYYLSRGMPIDGFARNLSFFFSNGMDPEYAVIGRVARRIWAVAMKDLYGAGERAQKLKYHIQTSGRSLHAQEIQFNDIRTTLQALYAIYDNCNSLHTNAYDEAITTPTEESVRRAIAIQLIINRELGLAYNHNPLQGSFLIEELTELVEEAILAEFDRLTQRGGVLGAMETMYQRGKIQEESLTYEQRKHDGSYPIVGINTFRVKDAIPPVATPTLIRSTGEEKRSQIEGLDQFRALHAAESGPALEKLKQVARSGGNLFAELMECVKFCSLGEISGALYQVGGQYRRNM